MMGFLFIAFVITLLAGMVIASAGDELHAIWLKLMDAIHQSPAENYYQQSASPQSKG